MTGAFRKVQKGYISGETTIYNLKATLQTLKLEHQYAWYQSCSTEFLTVVRSLDTAPDGSGAVAGAVAGAVGAGVTPWFTCDASLMPTLKAGLQQGMQPLGGAPLAEKAWHDLFDTYGTHLPKQITLGAQRGVTMRISKSLVEKSNEGSIQVCQWRR